MGDRRDLGNGRIPNEVNLELGFIEAYNLKVLREQIYRALLHYKHALNTASWTSQKLRGVELKQSIPRCLESQWPSFPDKQSFQA